MYEEKQRSGSASQKTMLSLLWDLEELRHINEEGRKLRTAITIALDILRMPLDVQKQHNLPRKLGSIRSLMRDVIKVLYRFKRTPASHMFVMMISSAFRNKKPYALPVQCLPYAGLKESDMRRMVNTLTKEMVNQGMRVAGKHVHTQYALKP